MALNVADFIAKLKGGGARPNKFRVIMPFPTYAIVGGETSDLTFLCKGAALPSSTLGVIDVPFGGRKVKLAGDRNDDEGWSITVINDTDFKLRNAFERWQNAIHSHKTNIGLTNLNDYVVDAIVQQLDSNGNAVKQYTFEGMWPEKISSIELSYDSENQIEEFTVDFQYINIVTDTTT